MSNLAKVHDHQALKISFIAIHSYVRSKNYVHNKEKELASRDIHSLLNNLFLRRMTNYFLDLKYRSTNKYKQALLKVFTMTQNLNNKIRTMFLDWKQKT